MTEIEKYWGENCWGTEEGRVSGKKSKENMEALGKGYGSINIWDRSELKLAWFRKNKSYFENNFPIFFFSKFFKVFDILHWVNFLLI